MAVEQQGSTLPGGATTADRLADTRLLHHLLDRLEHRVGGKRRLADCTGRMEWPRRGVYFFFEPGEERSGSGAGPRLVRVGTHAITAQSRSKLWTRLSQHRGTARGGGNHRGSVFREIVGAALARRGDLPLPRSWGVGSSRGEAAKKLGLTRDEVKAAEAELELRVSHYVGALPFLWVDVDDEPGADGSETH